MKKWDRERTVWSCRLCTVPEEEETAQLEQELRARRLHFAVDAQALQQYISRRGCSQEEAARRLGRAQSSVANRLRLLKLPEDVLLALQEGELTERHGRALLRLPAPEQQREALAVILRAKMSVAAAESYVDELTGKRAGMRCAFFQDPSVLLRSLTKDLDVLRRSGLDVTAQYQDAETEFVITVRIPKRPI